MVKFYAFIFNLTSVRDPRFFIGRRAVFALIYSLLLTNISFAGNTCGTATAITVNGACDATRVDGTAGTAIGSCTGTIAREEWWSFSVTSGQSYTVTYTTSTNDDPVIVIYNGACPGTYVACQNATGTGNPITETYSFTAASTGTYFVRMLNYNSGNMDGSLCITSPPSNDEPTGAISITPGATCTMTSYTNAGATSSTCGTIPAPGCAGYAGGDVWFSVVVPASGALFFSTTAGVMTDGGMAVYTGTACGVMTLVSCDDNTGAGSMPELTLGGLTPSTTIFIRVWENGNDNNGTFNLCVQTLNPPANDNPGGATSLTVGTSCSYTASTNASATPTTCGTIPAPGCAGYGGGDVWFSAVVPSSGTLVISTTSGVMTDGGMAVYTGTSCGVMTLVSCDDNSGPGNMPELSLTGLTAATTIFIRVWENGNNNNGTFNICIYDPTPVNDNPTGAISITPSTTCSYATYTNANATSSTCGTIPAPGCAGYAGGDVWFSVVVPSTGSLFISSSDVGGMTDGGMAVYTGTACGVMTLVSCNDNGGPGNMPELNLTGLTVGSTVFIRFWENGNDNNGTFGLCVSYLPNDDPSGAISITPGTICSYTTYTNQNATSTTCGTIATPGCAGYAGGDVWFSVVVPASGSLFISSGTGVMTDGGMAVYSGTACGTMTLISCDDNTGPGSMPQLNLTGLTAGSTIFIRFWENGNNNNGTFDLCVSSPCPTGSQPNDNCSNATLLPFYTSSCTQTAGSVACATASADANSCGATIDDDDVWYMFVPTTTGAAISISSVTGTSTDLYHSVYTGTCGSLGAAIACSDPDASTLTGLTIGQTYYIRVYSNSTTTQTITFGICVNSINACGNPTNNDYCESPASITAGASTFASSTASTYTADNPGNVASVFCGTVQNNSWYEFVASSTTEVFTIPSVTGCTSNGIQAEVYSITYTAAGCCNNFTSMSNCFNPGTATGGTVTATGLTAGQKYVLMIDGYSGANCNYTLTGWVATGVLPVELTLFTGKNIGNGNLLEWQTMSEINCDFFSIERSIDGYSFGSVGIVGGHGSTNATNNYQFYDQFSTNTNTYYRLKQFDTDGSFHNSNTIVVYPIENDDVYFYPNPTNEILNIEFYAEQEGEFFIQISDLSGRSSSKKIMAVEGVNHLRMDDFESLPKGAYLISLMGPQKLILKTEKVIKY